MSKHLSDNYDYYSSWQTVAFTTVSKDFQKHTCCSMAPDSPAGRSHRVNLRLQLCGTACCRGTQEAMRMLQQPRVRRHAMSREVSRVQVSSINKRYKKKKKNGQQFQKKAMRKAMRKLQTGQPHFESVRGIRQQREEGSLICKANSMYLVKDQSNNLHNFKGSYCSI